MEEKRKEIEKQYSRRVTKFALLLWIPDLFAFALLLLRFKVPESTGTLFLYAAIAILLSTSIILHVSIRKMAAKRNAELKELERQYRPLEDWYDQLGDP